MFQINQDLLLKLFHRDKPQVIQEFNNRQNQ
jgi:hypothetical protein